ALLYRRAEPYFYAFDLLTLDGADLRDAPLRERKRRLRRLLGRRRGRVRYLDHVVGHGVDLFRPSPRRPSIAPIPAPSIRPIPMPMVPPVGTRACAPRYVCNGVGCRWQTVCQ